MKQINPLNTEQQQAVFQRNKDILVSAPAGSGKTKILVSRIITLIVEEKYHIDEFLVLTFTQAAATEMKQRLVLALNQEIQKSSGTLVTHLELQKEKLPLAYITNFHGFCNSLLEKYGYLIGINSGYSILSETNALKNQTLEELLEKWVQDTTFIEFQTLYFPKNNISAIKKLLLDLMRVMSSMSNQQNFIKQVEKNIYDFIIEANQDLSFWIIFEEIKKQLKETCIIGINKIYELKIFAIENEITPFYDSTTDSKNKNNLTPMEALLIYYQNLLETLNQDNLLFNGVNGLNELSRQAIQKSYNIPWKNLSDKANQAKPKFNDLKSKINKLYKEKFEQIIDSDSNEQKLIFSKIKEIITYIVGENGLLTQFQETYQKNKQLLNQLDFNDLEFYTIKLLQPKYQISKILHKKLKEIMIDEYQDTNMIQETITTMIAHHKKPFVNCFMVGDMKQSIYRFRQADPEIFKNKYEQYGTLDQTSIKIELLYNYRSNKIVLDSINYIFNQIMDQNIGQLEYYHDKKAQLNYDFLRKEGAKTTDEKALVTKKASKRITKENHLATEILLLDKSSLTNEITPDNQEYEAHIIALRIKEMIEKPLMIKQYPNKERPVNYQDIVILMRATTSFLTFKKVFNYHDIPNHIILSQGFIHSIEVVNIITLVKAINNRYDDISLLSVLRAPYLFSYFKDEEIAEIRVSQKNETLYKNLINYQDSKLKEKINDFLKTFEYLITSSRTTPFKDWFQELFELTNYPNFVINQINGEQRHANLSLLMEKVQEETKPRSFNDWVNEFNKWIQYEENNTPGMVHSENTNTVSFMTIHKSKGLEFPIVFVANQHKKFNMQDGKERFIVDKNAGMTIKPRIKTSIPLDIMGEELALNNVIIEYENPYLKILSNLSNNENISEEMRIYYVALTRASQKLILTGVIDKEEILDWQQKIIANEEAMPNSKDSQHIILYHSARKTNSYIQWLGLSLMRHPQVLNQLKEESFNLIENIDQNFINKIRNNCETIETFNYQSKYNQENTEHSQFLFKLYSYQIINENKGLKAINQKTQTLNISKTTITKYLNYQYPYNETIDYNKSIAVTSLEKQKITSNSNLIYQPLDQTKSPLSSAKKGTLIHSFMEFIPLDSKVTIKETIEQLFNKGLYNLEEKQVLLDYLDKFENFRRSDLFKLIIKADSFYREKTFTYLDLELNQVVHGIFDALIIDKQKVIIIDYKSDKVSHEAPDDALRKKHQHQISYYKKIAKNLYPDKDIKAYLVYLEINRYVGL